WTTYFASASVIALAIGFGSQGIVQDVVTGLTLIFSDLIDVGDMVEISGQSGVVRSISMRRCGRGEGRSNAGRLRRMPRRERFDAGSPPIARATPAIQNSR